ncbi:MAG: FAD-binding oxidoreductase [Streptomyces sp.]|nr:FAD-binding oxidoreductase [Streptomyces sp.]
MGRRSVLAAGGGALAVSWLTGCDSSGSKGDGKSPASSPASSRPAPSATPSRTATPARSATAADWPALASALRGTLVRPQDAAYATDRRLYNTRFDGLRPAAVAYVTGTDDVRRCLDFARRTGTTPTVRSGGHSYAGFSSGDGRLVIDVSRLKSIRLDGDEAAVAAGAKLIDVYDTLGRQGRTIPAGSCPSVGVSGLALGGGHGVMSRSMGLTCDNLIGATLVTADGTVHEVSEEHEPDILWALRGAGCGNFGVVTSLRFTTHPAPQVVTGYLTWPWSRAADVVAAWQGWGPDLPDHIWSALHLDCAPGGSPTVSVPMLSSGSRADLAAAADRLASDVGSPATSVSLHPHGYVEAMFSYAGCGGWSAASCHLAPAGRLRRETYTARSDFYDAGLSAAGVSALLAQVQRLANARGGGAGSIALTALGGAVNRVAPTATAFSHRRSRFLAQYLASDALSTTGWLDTTHDAMRRHASGAAYQNYTDPALKDWRTAYYGPNAARLTALKHTLDPDRLFDFPQAL